MTTPIERFEDLFYDLHTGVVGDHERPHKPALLLALMDLVGSGFITENLVPFSTELRDHFAEYFEIVRSQDDRDTPWNPYFYLRSEPFWSHVATAGNEAVVAALNNPPAVGQIPNLIAGARLDDDLWRLLKHEENRSRLRDVLISRYFPEHLQQIQKLAGPLLRLEESPAVYDTSGRSTGFRRVVVQVYEHQCAACGLRVLLPDGVTLVDAAHLIPFARSHDDHPGNGIALCKNHHWAMDRDLIAPGPDFQWHISLRLDDRQEGQRKLQQLAGREIMLPKEKAYWPKESSLEWRLSQLD